MSNVSITFQVPEVLQSLLPAFTSPDNKSNQVIFVDSDQAFALLQSVLDLVQSQKERNAITTAFCAD